MKPLNEIARLALTQANGSLRDYVMRIVALLPSGDNEEPSDMVEADVQKTSREWAANTAQKLDKDVRQEVDMVRDMGVLDIASLPDRLPYAVGAAFPTAAELGGVFNEGWSEEVWKQIEYERAERGINISNRLWESTKDAQFQINDIIKQSEAEHWTYKETKDKLAELLTEKGRANVGYNVRRLWVDQIKRNHLIAQRQQWKDVGYVDTIIFSRSDHAYECDICGEEIGNGPGAEVEVALDYDGDWPPFHPWCACGARPKMPTQEKMRAFLNAQLGSLPVQQLMQGKTIVAPMVIPPVPPVPSKYTAAELQKRADNLVESDKNLDALIKRVSTVNSWTSEEGQIVRDRVHQTLGGLLEALPLPEIKYLKGSSGYAARWVALGRRIEVNSRYAITPLQVATEILHEYGHDLTKSLSLDALHVAAGSPLLYFTSPTDVADLFVEVNGFLSVIQEFTAYTFQQRGLPYAVNPNISLTKLQDIVTSVQDMMFASNYQLNGDKLKGAIRDLGVGRLSRKEHSTASLRDTWQTIQFVRPGPVYGLAEQEVFNQLWQFATNTELPSLQAFGTYMDTQTPGLMDAVKRWGTFAARP